MASGGTDQPDGVRRDLEEGLRLARQERYAEAAVPLERVRLEVERVAPALSAKLDGFLAIHNRYAHAEHVLHEASEQFARARAEQRTRLDDLTRSFTSLWIEREVLETAPGWDPGMASGRPDEQSGAGVRRSLPVLSIRCFGRFEVRQSEQRVALCPNRNGQAILRYLAAQPDHRATIDVLLDVLWPEEDPEAGRHKLYVASSALRRSLNGEHAREKGTGYLLCDNGAYQLNPDAGIRVDSDDFLALYRAGQRADPAARVDHFEAACRLHAGVFLPEDLYADWAAGRREQLVRLFLTMCGTLAGHYLAAGQYASAIQWALAMLAEDRCDETATRQLMRAYNGSGQRHEALRRYQVCQRTLSDELGVEPMPETTSLYHAILHGEAPLTEGNGAVGNGSPATTWAAPSI